MPTTDEVHVRPDGIKVIVRRSTRRTRGVSASWREGAALVQIPARMSELEASYWSLTMVERLLARQGAVPVTENEVTRRALELSELYLESRARPTSVRWVTNQRRRWGSATASDGTIRLSSRLQGMPDWVIDHVLVHELAHLIASDGHGPEFRALEDRYPRRAEAQAFLDGAAWALDRQSPQED